MATLPYELKSQTIIGKNLRNLRENRGLSQQALAQSLGITFQQVQKYEKGRSGISAARLYAISHILDTPLESFFNGISKPRTATAVPPPLHPTILLRAHKLQNECTPQKRTEILKILDMLMR